MYACADERTSEGVCAWMNKPAEGCGCGWTNPRKAAGADEQTSAGLQVRVDKPAKGCVSAGGRTNKGLWVWMDEPAEGWGYG